MTAPAREALAAIARDGAAIGGVALIIYGIAAIYPPAAFIAAGLAAIAGAVLSAMLRA